MYFTCHPVNNTVTIRTVDAAGSQIGSSQTVTIPNGAAGRAWHDHHRVESAAVFRRSVLLAVSGNLVHVDTDSGVATRVASLDFLAGDGETVEDAYAFGDGPGKHHVSCVCAMSNERVAIGTRWSGGEVLIVKGADLGPDGMVVEAVVDLMASPSKLGTISAICKAADGGYVVFGHEVPWRWAFVLVNHDATSMEWIGSSPWDVRDFRWNCAYLHPGLVWSQRSGLAHDTGEYGHVSSLPDPFTTAGVSGRAKVYALETGALLARFKVTALRPEGGTVLATRLDIEEGSLTPLTCPPMTEGSVQMNNKVLWRSRHLPGTNASGAVDKALWVDALMPRPTFPPDLASGVTAYPNPYIEHGSSDVSVSHFPFHQRLMGTTTYREHGLDGTPFKVFFRDEDDDEKMHVRRYVGTATGSGNRLRMEFRGVGSYPSPGGNALTPIGYEPLGVPVIVRCDSGLNARKVIRLDPDTYTQGEWFDVCKRSGQAVWCGFAPVSVTGGVTPAMEIRGYDGSSLTPKGTLALPTGRNRAAGMAYFDDLIRVVAGNDLYLSLVMAKGGIDDERLWSVEAYDATTPYALSTTVNGQFVGDGAVTGLPVDTVKS